MKIYVDINTGVIRRSVGGPAVPILHFHQNDLISLQVVLLDGSSQVTSTSLAGGKTIDAEIRGYPLASKVFATGESPELSGETLSLSLDLESEEIDDYFADFVPASSRSVDAVFELQIRDGDTSRETIHQSRVLLFRDMNAGNDTPTPGAPADFDSTDFDSNDFST